MTPVSNKPRRSQPHQSQPARLHRQNATLRAPEMAVEQANMRGAWDYVSFIQLLRRAAAAESPSMAQYIARLEDTMNQINPSPTYTALPTGREITIELSVPEPEYTRYARDKKRKREEDDKE